MLVFFVKLSGRYIVLSLVIHGDTILLADRTFRGFTLSVSNGALQHLLAIYMDGYFLVFLKY